jgi:hypothetical protein
MLCCVWRQQRPAVPLIMHNLHVVLLLLTSCPYQWTTNFLQIQTINALNFIAIPTTKRYKLYIVQPCVPRCHVCGHCWHRCNYVFGIFGDGRNPKRPRCVVERDWSASGFPRKASSKMLVEPQIQSRFDSQCSEVVCCVFWKVIGSNGRRRLASAHRNIAEALRLLRLLCRVPLSVPFVLFIASNQRLLV